MILLSMCRLHCVHDMPLTGRRQHISQIHKLLDRLSSHIIIAVSGYHHATCLPSMNLNLHCLVMLGCLRQHNLGKLRDGVLSPLVLRLDLNSWLHLNDLLLTLVDDVLSLWGLVMNMDLRLLLLVMLLLLLHLYMPIIDSHRYPLTDQGWGVGFSSSSV